MREAVKARFEAEFRAKPRYIFSAPGRTELGGNHTDHQRGRVLAAAVELYAYAAVSPRADRRIRLSSAGYPLYEMDLCDTDSDPAETGTPIALLRGIAAGLSVSGAPKYGADIAVCSEVPVGSGLSSSAAFEILIGTVLSRICFELEMDAVRLAQIAQAAENRYFGKPCGLMDQTACAVGGVVGIDFADPQHPRVERLEAAFPGHALCIIDSGADHAALTAEYAAIPAELARVCAYFGKSVLREVEEAAFYRELPALRRRAGDRAVLRAMHVFEENRRVSLQLAALRSGDFSNYLELVRASGRSSWMYLQNVICPSAHENQQLACAIALCEHLLGGRGACRVHGGGFAGSLQAFVPNEILEEFVSDAEAVLGRGSCRCLHISRHGGRLLEELD